MTVAALAVVTGSMVAFHHPHKLATAVTAPSVTRVVQYKPADNTNTIQGVTPVNTPTPNNDSQPTNGSANPTPSTPVDPSSQAIVVIPPPANVSYPMPVQSDNTSQ